MYQEPRTPETGKTAVREETQTDAVTRFRARGLAPYSQSATGVVVGCSRSHVCTGFRRPNLRQDGMKVMSCDRRHESECGDECEAAENPIRYRKQHSPYPVTFPRGVLLIHRYADEADNPPHYRPVQTHDDCRTKPDSGRDVQTLSHFGSNVLRDSGAY
jgi:hypothetical protein